MRKPIVLLGALLLITCVGSEDPVEAAPAAQAEDPAEASPAAAKVEEKVFAEAGGNSLCVASALEVFKADLWAIITIENYQWVIAICSIVFGGAALWDGRFFFKFLVSASIAALAFTITLSQLRPTWTGEVALKAKYVASLEAGLFVGFAAYTGFDGTQLLLGGALGLYLFHAVQGVAQTIPYLDVASNHSIWIVIVCSLMVALGSWALHARYGAGRVLGVLAPVFGGSLVVATLSYLFMLSCTLPAIGEKLLHAQVLPSDVPSVFEFWYMIVYPLHSQAVGFFHFTNRTIIISNIKFEIDRVLGLSLWAIISALGICKQIKADRAERDKFNSSLKVRLIQKGNNAPLAPEPIADESGRTAPGATDPEVPAATSSWFMPWKTAAAPGNATA